MPTETTQVVNPCPSEWERRAIRATLEHENPCDPAGPNLTTHGWMLIHSDDPDDSELGRFWADGEEDSWYLEEGRYDPEDFNEPDAELISRVLDHIQGYPLGSMQGTRANA